VAKPHLRWRVKMSKGGPFGTMSLWEFKTSPQHPWATCDYQQFCAQASTNLNRVAITIRQHPHGGPLFAPLVLFSRDGDTLKATEAPSNAFYRRLFLFCHRDKVRA